MDYEMMEQAREEAYWRRIEEEVTMPEKETWRDRLGIWDDEDIYDIVVTLGICVLGIIGFLGVVVYYFS
jgi:hypothetical protein